MKPAKNRVRIASNEEISSAQDVRTGQRLLASLIEARQSRAKRIQPPAPDEDSTEIVLEGDSIG